MLVCCDSCGTCYAIDDERVRGRAFRVCCRRCGAPVSIPVRAARAKGRSRWYLALEGVEAGPLTTHELRRSLRAGELAPETLAWREGLADWTSLRQLAELADGSDDGKGRADAARRADPVGGQGRDRLDPPTVAPAQREASPVLVASRNESSVRES